MSEFFGEGWSQFTRRIFISRDQATVFQHWARSGGLTKWFFETAEYLDGDGNARAEDADAEIGDVTRWKWFGWDQVQEGKVIDVATNQSIDFSFSPAGNVKVEFLKAGDARTEIVLTQTEIPHGTDAEKKDFFYGCSLGWSFWMVNCKSFLEHGILLNERDQPYAGDKRLCQLVNH